MRAFCGILVASLFLLNCGKSPSSTLPASFVKESKTSIDVQATRIGQALYIEVSGQRKSMPREGAFEDSTQWAVGVHSKGQRLKKVTNGSSRVEREEHYGTGLFDTTLKMSMGYAMPSPAASVDVTILEPGRKARKIKVDVISRSTRVAGR